jgi:hypothetical protein
MTLLAALLSTFLSVWCSNSLKDLAPFSMNRIAFHKVLYEKGSAKKKMKALSKVLD